MFSEKVPDLLANSYLNNLLYLNIYKELLYRPTRLVPYMVWAPRTVGGVAEVE